MMSVFQLFHLKRDNRKEFVTVRNEVAKVMFLHLSVILFTGGLPQCMLGCHHPPSGTRHTLPPTPRTMHPHPPGTMHTPPGPCTSPRQLLLRMVRILLECILVSNNCLDRVLWHMTSCIFYSKLVSWNSISSLLENCHVLEYKACLSFLTTRLSS